MYACLQGSACMHETACVHARVQPCMHNTIRLHACMRMSAKPHAHRIAVGRNQRVCPKYKHAQMHARTHTSLQAYVTAEQGQVQAACSMCNCRWGDAGGEHHASMPRCTHERMHACMTDCRRGCWERRDSTKKACNHACRNVCGTVGTHTGLAHA